MNFLSNTFMNAYRKKHYPNYWDAVALFFVLSLVIFFAWSAKQMSAPYHVGEPLAISLDPSNLPGYALRTVSRMLLALLFSLIFTFVVATWAVKSKRAEKIIIPFIDILQSVPILGYLSVAVVAFIGLFPGSMLGPECAVVFVLFTSQAWNMVLGFYQTMSSVPPDLKEAANMFHLSAWQRFWRIEVPFSMPGLLWNTMMSMSAGWFYVVFSEAISVNNQTISLPGIGSYIALAINTMNLQAIGYAILTMFIVILAYDQFLFRPLVAWSEKFKSDSVSSEQEASSWLINLFHRTRFMRNLGRKIAILFDRFVNAAMFRSRAQWHRPTAIAIRWERSVGWAWDIVIFITLIAALLYSGQFVVQHVTLSETRHVFMLGLITALRVFIMIIVCSLIWVPVGVWIGLRPRLAEVMQPIAQFLAAFPANLLYPLVVIMIVKYHLSVNVWVTPLMILGSQWYILFNVIAGATAIPKDLLQVADNLGLNVVLRWRRLILPAIFPFYITGAITAVGGAWNASIAAEVVSWGNEKLVATGLGAYITQYTKAGDFIHIALGIGMMCILVLVLNRLIWRPLYRLAMTRFPLE